jgi:hypothetical protein
MIYLTGYGQMCNNMLQFGHTYAICKEHNLKVIGLRFCYKYLYFEISTMKHYNWITYVLVKYAAKIGLIKTIIFDDEESLTVKKNEMLSAKTTFVNGWFLRDYELFLKHQEEIKNLFAFKKSITQKLDYQLKSHQNLKIGVHIRRGDYVRWHSGKYFFTDEEYLKILKSFLSKLHQKVDVIIFTNDDRLNKSIYTQNLNNIEVTFANGNQAQDLYYLSNCDYIIGPPSTFSLMASFYNHKPLYWIYDKDLPINPQSFNFFEYHFRNII